MGYGVVALGPGGSYLFSSPRRWSRNRLPPEIDELFGKGPPLREVYECNLGLDGSYIITYKTAYGEQLCTHDGLQQGLLKWLIPVDGGPLMRDIESLSIALGPNGSYFAFDKNGSSWDNISAEFEQVLAERLQPWGNWRPGKGPRSVTLGPDGSFIFIDTSGMAHWSDNLQYQAPGLNKVLSSFAPSDNLDHYFILNPGVPGTWVVMSLKGKCSAILPPHMLSDFDCFAKDWNQECNPPLAQRTRNQSLSYLSGSSAARPSFPVHGLFGSNNPLMQQSNPFDPNSQSSPLSPASPLATGGMFTPTQPPSMDTFNNGMNMLGIGLNAFGIPFPSFS